MCVNGRYILKVRAPVTISLSYIADLLKRQKPVNIDAA
jgi:hypothetical protein